MTRPELAGRHRVRRHTRRPRPVAANPAAERAIRAARAAGVGQPEPSRIPWHFIFWVVARLCAFAVLGGSAYALYDLASSDQFQVRTVHVTGSALLSQGQVEGIAAVTGANVFWIDRQDVEARLRALPVVQSVQVEPVLPNSVNIQLRERTPAAYWQQGDQTFLVDPSGVVLEPANQAPDPHLNLPTIVETDNTPLQPGSKVDPSILATSTQLASLLPAAGVQPSAFQWSAQTGLEVPTQAGVTVRFAPQAPIQPQIATLRAIQDYLSGAKESAHLIDVRFPDRPYYQ